MNPRSPSFNYRILFMNIQIQTQAHSKFGDKIHPVLDSNFLSKSFLTIGLILSLVILISAYSSYEKSEIPWDLSWHVSPLGLLFSRTPHELLTLESKSFFLGKLGFYFDYLFVFLKTCFLEFPFYWFALKSKRFLMILSYLFIANFLTHPIVFFAFPSAFNLYLPSLLCSELYAAAAEMIFIGWVCRSKTKPWTSVQSGFWILIANLFSWQVGVFL